MDKHTVTREYPPHTYVHQMEFELRPKYECGGKPKPIVGTYCTVCGGIHRTQQGRFRCVDGQ